MPTLHLTAAEFFRDSPWLNIPSHRKADITVEPLYPRMGLLGGASESSGKVSKLAALAAARKKKEGEKASGSATPDSSVETRPQTPDGKGGLSLRERLAGNGRPVKPAEGRGLGKEPHPAPVPKQPSPEDDRHTPTQGKEPGEETVNKENEPPKPATPSIRAPPSTFATTIVGDATRPKMTEPSHMHSNGTDLLKIYGQGHAEPFDFAGPSPDDVVSNAQSSAKGLAIRRKM